jgi:hypothetical protein
MTPMRKRVGAFLAASALIAALAPSAMGAASPPTNGGNGAGQSGQCTGPPAERPPVCPAT